MPSRTVNLNPKTHVTSLNDTSPISLGGGGSNTVDFEVGLGFATDPTVSELTLYQWDDNAPNHQGPHVGTWTRSPVGNTLPNLTVTTNEANIQVSDTNVSNDEYDYCFTVTVQDSNGNHTTVDPELRVKKKTLG